MEMTGIAFGTTDWSTVEATRHRGESGGEPHRSRSPGGARLFIVD